jgi:hypothetical protein
LVYGDDLANSRFTRRDHRGDGGMFRAKSDSARGVNADSDVLCATPGNDGATDRTYSALI